MAATLRVHHLAKELGVESKAIIAKCAAEGVELKNHMAVVSLGLAESIREWFSVGDDITSVELAERVNVDAIRKPSRRSKGKSGGADHEDQGDDTTSTAVAEPPGDTDLVADESESEQSELRIEPEIEQPALQPLVPAAMGSAPPAPPPPTISEPVIDEPPAFLRIPVADVPAAAPIAAKHGHVPVPPAPPPPRRVAVPPPPAEPVRPAGPQLVPRPAELTGPRVVRIEAPEPLRPQRPRPPMIGGEPRTPAATTDAPGTAPRHGIRGRGKAADDEAEKRKLGAQSPRRLGRDREISEQRLREWREQDQIELRERLASATGSGLRDRKAAERRRQATPHGLAPAGRRAQIEITVPITVKDMCAAIGVPFSTISAKLMEHTGDMWTKNRSLDLEMAEMLALDLGLQLKFAKAKTAYDRLRDAVAERERDNLQPRPPVVAMLGHVDHGKTSLLDAIRQTRVAAGEAGGITQHIGAYRIDRGNWHVTFLDTPGHQAFTAMRARGANLTDVVVLVVAADDGLMPQTIEAINHAKAAGVTIVVALNKVDLPGVDFNRIYSALSEQDLIPSEWGGTTDVIKTSATKGTGIEELIAHLSTLSELLDLKADPTVPAVATVIEAKMREGQGVVAQVLVREGTLRPGQIIVCGPGFGKVRLLRDDKGERMTAATPGTPVEVTGLDESPQAGDQLYQVDSQAEAKEIAAEVKQQRREVTLDAGRRVRKLEDLVKAGDSAEVEELNVILKADVRGSVDVLIQEFAKIPSTKARLKILHSAVGVITEADVALAQASGAMIIGFNIVPEERARQLAEQVGVQIRVYRVIYQIMEDLEKALVGLLEPEKKQETRGTAEVRQVFNNSRFGSIAGCLVTDGVITRNNKVRLIRDGRIILEGSSIGSLKRFKDDAREVKAGLECGIKIENFDDVKPQDVIQAYDIVEIAQKLT